MREHRPNKLNALQIKKINERLKAMRKTRETLEQIAADFGVSAQTVGYHAKKLPPEIKFKPVSKEIDEAEVLRLYGIHMNQTIVARELGIPGRTISHILARMEKAAA